MVLCPPYSAFAAITASPLEPKAAYPSAPVTGSPKPVM
jgi:hypothetical protein